MRLKVYLTIENSFYTNPTIKKEYLLHLLGALISLFNFNSSNVKKVEEFPIKKIIIY